MSNMEGLPISSLRNKCRTCTYLCLNDGNTMSGYCWQSDKPVNFTNHTIFPRQLDLGCPDILGTGEDPAWAPLAILAHYFREGA